MFKSLCRLDLPTSAWLYCFVDEESLDHIDLSRTSGSHLHTKWVFERLEKFCSKIKVQLVD